MTREIYVVKNNTSSDIELMSFGIILSSGQTIELGDYDLAVLSNDLYENIRTNKLIRIIDNVPVDSGSSYTIPMSDDYYSKSTIDTFLNQKSSTGHSHSHFYNDVVILGDLYISGITTTMDVNNLNIKDNIILINSGETGNGVTSVISGIQVDRGIAIDYQFVFDESTDSFKIGEIGSLQKVATREDSPINGNLVVWSTSSNRFDTSINPNTFASSAHTHTSSNISDLSVYSGFTTYYTKTSVDTLLNQKSSTGHTHTTSNITDISTYSSFTNYYIKTSVDTLLSQRSSTGHTHTTSNITDISTYSSFTNYYTKTSIDTLLNGKANTGTTLSSYGITDAYTKTNMDTLLNQRSSTGHTHTSSDITNLSTVLNGYSVTGHTHTTSNITDISTYSSFTNYYTKTNVDTLLNGKANTGTTLSSYGITDAYTKTSVDTLLNQRSSTGHTHTTSNITDISTYSGFTSYYIKSQVDNLLTGNTFDSSKYYTSGQTDTLLNQKSSTGHTHITSNITDISTYSSFTNYYTKTSTDTLLNQRSSTGHTHITDNITNLSSYSGFTNYYTKPLTDAQFIKGTVVDATNIADGRSLIYDSTSGNIIYKSILDTMPSVQIRRTSDFTVTTSWSNVVFDTVDIENKPTTLYWDLVNTDRIYVLDSGYYNIMFQSKVTCTTTTTQTSVQMLVNGSNLIEGSDTYVNVYQVEIHPLITNVITYLSGGSYVSVQVMRNQTSSTLLANPRFIMYKMDGIKGAVGATGAGSNVIVKHDNVNLVNTPHSNLNFTGGISAVDAGGGVATISTPLYGTEFHYAQDTGATTNSTTTYATKVTLTTSTLSGGIYRIMVSYGVRKDTSTSDWLSRVMLDGTMIGYVNNVELSDATSYPYTTRVFYRTLTAATHTILLQFNSESSGTVTMQDATIELVRVS